MDQTAATTSRNVSQIIALLAIALLAGCATLSESQCAANDWQTVGYSDGVSGQDSSRLLKHQNACMKHGVTPDRMAYMTGWEEGVVRYCTPDNGFQQGQRGSSYRNVCPSGLEPGFHEAYLAGRELHLAQAEITRMQRSIVSKSKQLEKVEKDLRDAEAWLVAGDTSEIERMRWLDETKSLARTQGKLESEITELRIQSAVKKEQLETLRQTLAMGY
jgi:hypothetical protein